MKKVEILGTGCMKCTKLYELTKKVVADNGLDAEVVKIEDIQEIVSRGVMMTPGLVVDGQIKSSGKLPSAAEIVDMIGE